MVFGNGELCNNAYRKSISGFAFVNDSNFCISRQPTVEQTATHMQQSVTNWEGLLRTMGRALIP